jgi:positive regulator of sigma E activity
MRVSNRRLTYILSIVCFILSSICAPFGRDSEVVSIITLILFLLSIFLFSVADEM